MRAASLKVNRVLVIDVGGTHVKVVATGQREERRIPSGSKMTATKMVRDVKRLAKGWQYDCVSIGYPGPVIQWAPRARAPQSRRRLGRIQLREGVRPSR
jgi:predicted NBD/HSP70 family sugar kinase